MKKSIPFLSILSILTFLGFVSDLNARVKRIDWGKQKQTSPQVYLNNTEQIQGSDGSQDIILKENEHSLNDTTDLLIHFNEAPVQIEGRYRVRKENFLTSYQNKALGRASAKFYRPERQELLLEPLEGSIFKGSTFKSQLKDFTIEFWLNPLTLMDGEVIFRYGGPVLETDQLIGYSGIVCKIQNRRLHWNLAHLFYPLNQNPETENETENQMVQISGTRRLKQGKWQHHALSFQSIDGRIRYFVDGKLESEQVLTDSNQTVLKLRFSSNSLLSIGTSFLGYIDEWVISRIPKLPKPFLLTQPQKRKATPYLQTHNYKKTQGTVLSPVYDLGHPQAQLRKLNTRFQEFHGNVILLSYRMSPKSFSFDLPETVLPWQVLSRDTKLNRFWIPQNPKGRYFQWRAILKSEGKSTPILQEISFELHSPKTISPPQKLRAFTRNNSIQLEWFANLEENLKGYRIYFGFESGNYLIPQAPIWIDTQDLANPDKPSYLLSNLSQGQGYFFVIRALDQNQIESESSNEAYVYLQE